MAGGKATYWTITVGLCEACFLAILPSLQRRFTQMCHPQAQEQHAPLFLFLLLQLYHDSNIERHDVVIDRQLSNAIACPFEPNVIEKLLLRS